MLTGLTRVPFSRYYTDILVNPVFYFIDHILNKGACPRILFKIRVDGSLFMIIVAHYTYLLIKEET